MERLDQLSKLQRLLSWGSSGAVGAFGSKEGHRVVSPVIPESLGRDWIHPHQFVFVKFGHRHQFNGGHAKVFQIRNLFSQRAEGSRMRYTRTRMNGEAANVGLIDNRVSGGMLWRSIRLPVEIVVGKDAFRRGAGVVHNRQAQVSQSAGRIVAAGS